VAKAGRPAAADPARSAAVRAALVSAAIDALREDGFAGASAREVARRAGCSQGLVFYHFGTVNGLLLAALDEVSARRMAAYRDVLEEASSAVALVDSARSIFVADLEAGYVRVLVELINGAQAVPGLGEQVAARLEPWREFARAAAARMLGKSALARLIPADEAAHAIVAGFLGVELLASLDGDRDAALALFDRARSLARLLDVAGGVMAPVKAARDATRQRKPAGQGQKGSTS
jgi:AcrR family transcriptional regulator